MTITSHGIILTCGDCQIRFTFTTGERQFYEARGFAPPVRCPACRAVRRQKRDAMAATGSESVGGSIAAPGQPDPFRVAVSRPWQ